MGFWTPGPGPTDGDDIFEGDGLADVVDGGAGNDTLNGGGGNDVLTGGAGADHLDGGSQRDAADYSASSSGVLVRLWNGTGLFGDAQGDTLVDIENLIGSAFSDGLIGSDVANLLQGMDGDDFLSGLGGGDVLNGGAGADRLDGGDANDVLIGGAGADLLDGGDRIDTADYAGSAAAVLVRLWNGTGLFGDAQGDTLLNIENLIGSAFDDGLLGSHDINLLQGEAGDDFLSGLGGGDTLEGGDGADRLDGGDGEDWLYGGAGDDILDGGAGDDFITGGDEIGAVDLVSYASATGGVTVDLGGSSIQETVAGRDFISGVEGAIGSSFNDVLTGGLFLDGGAGDDSLTGDWVLRGGAGADTLTRLGSGEVTADYSTSLAGVIVRLWNGTGQNGDAQGDRLIGITAVRGSAFGDLLIGSQGTFPGTGDLLEGGGGDDHLLGLEGDDRLQGGAGADHLFGDAGLDILAGGAGADVLNGGDGFDTADYSASTGGVVVRLWNGAGQLHDAQGDSMVSIEIVRGSAFSDALIGALAAGDALHGEDGDDYLSGLSGDDYLVGGRGDDLLEGGDGADTLVGSRESEYGDGHDTLRGGGGDDRLNGGFEDSLFYGEAGDDIITGHGLLSGGAGMDILQGTETGNRYLFDSALGPDNIDQVSFNLEDQIQLSAEIFAGLTPGALAQGAFHVGSAAADADDRIIYDPTTGGYGSLYFDPDGSGAAAQVLFAELIGSASPVFSDFLVV